MCSNGSSPRARGTRRQHHARRAIRRFIPAGAGNTSPVCPGAGPGPVHPRGRGEHLIIGRVTDSSIGSSPRARGTRPQPAPGFAKPRFIPAGAGNTRARPNSMTRSTVHPRGRGEHPAWMLWQAATDGSSPRARGTQSMPRRHGIDFRFIPAGAGNTSLDSRSLAFISVHPRGRGEHYAALPTDALTPGSSPRARGTCNSDDYSPGDVRFIPAGAGNTAFLTMQHGPSSGSSPRARGTLNNLIIISCGDRFIPAGAGNTVNRDQWFISNTVHPRGRGEHGV